MKTRRQFLHDVSLGTGAALLSGIVSQLRNQSMGVSPSTRFVFVLEGNGFRPDQFTPIGYQRPVIKLKRFGNRGPQGVTEMVNESLVGRELPKSLQPFGKYQAQLTIVNGLSGLVCGGGHSSGFGALTCRPKDGGHGPTGVSIDVELGKILGGIFTHVGLGISNRPSHDILYNCSAWGSGQAMPTICNPMTAYNTLFGSVAGDNAKVDFNAQRNLLDSLVGDVRRLEREVPSAERDKLFAHLKGYEDMRKRASRLGEIEGSLREARPEATDKFRSEVESDRLDAHFDIAAAALIGGLTNVVTIASGVGNHYFDIHFKGLGIPIDKHQIGHGEESGHIKAGLMEAGDTMTAVRMQEIIHSFHTGLIVRLMDKLKAVPEGDGSMLDNTVIVFLSDGAERHHSRTSEWPIMLLPGKNTALKGGQYIDYPYYALEGHRETGNLFTTLLHAAGDTRKYFGVHDPVLEGSCATDGALSELLT